MRILRDFQGSCGASGDIIMWQHRAVFIIITKNRYSGYPEQPARLMKLYNTPTIIQCML